MIESQYWRAELRNELAWLKKHRTYRRWTERQLVLFERKLMLVAFQVRSLLERPKVNDRARSAGVAVVRYKKVGTRLFSSMGGGWLDECFDVKNPEPSFLSAVDVCNQLIHYYWMQTWSEGKAFAGMLVFSDRMRHEWAYEIRIEDLLKLFEIFGQESSAVMSAKFVWNEKKQDYVLRDAKG